MMRAVAILIVASLALAAMPSTAAHSITVDDALSRVQRWLYPNRGRSSPSALPARPVAPAPVLATAPMPSLVPPPPGLVQPRSIVAPERPKQPKRTPSRPRVEASNGMPSCSVVRREYHRMNQAQRLAAYMSASAAQVAHGRKCLGL